MRLVDDLIAAVSPRAALRREMARQTLTELRAYAAAKTGRRTAGWTAGSGSASAEMDMGFARIRNRARSMIRDNEYASAAVERLAVNVIGTGITCLPANTSERQAWLEWSESTACDADGLTNLHGLCALAATHVFGDGEAIIRRRIRRAEDGLRIPLQLQVLEPDHLDHSKSGVLANGNVAILGVEYNQIGQRVAYWLYRQHPGEIAVAPRALESVRVPAGEVIHLFDRKRASQVRGVSRLAVSLMRLRDLADYEDAEIMRKKVEACFAAFVTTEEPDSVGALQTPQPGEDERIEKLAPGMIKYLKYGQSVEFANPSTTGVGSEFMVHQLHAVGVGTGLTYQQLTGDLRRANYTSTRAGLIEFYKLVDAWQWLLFIPGLVRPIRTWFQEAALYGGVATGSIGDDKITTPRKPHVDPLKDATAIKEQVRAGLMSLSEGIRELGEDPDLVFAEIARERETLKALGIVTDVDAAFYILKLDPMNVINATAEKTEGVAA